MLLMLSMPPATTTSCDPSIMDCAPNIMAFIPDAQTLFTSVQGILNPSPDAAATCVAGAWPRPDEMTFPTNNSSTTDASIPALLTAALYAIPASCIAEREASDAPKLPIGVRAAETITTSF